MSGWPATRKTGPNDASDIVWAKCKSFYLFFFFFFVTNYYITFVVHKEGVNKDNEGGIEDNENGLEMQHVSSPW